MLFLVIFTLHMYYCTHLMLTKFPLLIYIYTTVLHAELSQMLTLSFYIPLHLLSVLHDPGIVLTRVEGSFVTVQGD